MPPLPVQLGFRVTCPLPFVSYGSNPSLKTKGK